MTEYEIADLINSGVSNMFASQGFFVSIVSAYVVMAYATGRFLTLYQVAFLNFLFLVTSFAGLYLFANIATEIQHYNSMLAEARGLYSPLGDNAAIDNTLVYVGIATRVVITLGAIGFMWSVRHAKSE